MDLELRLYVCDRGHAHAALRQGGGPWQDSFIADPAAALALKDFEPCRDERGRFAPCGGVNAQGGRGRTAEEHAARKVGAYWHANEAVKAFRERKARGEATDEHVRALHDHLSGLTVGQLHALRKEHGLSASAPRKAELRALIVNRLANADRSAALAAHPSPAAPAPPAPKVYDRIPPGTYGPSRATLEDGSPAATRKADAAVAAVLGTGKDHHDLLSLAGAPHGAKAELDGFTTAAGGTGVTVDFNGTTPEGDYKGSRTVYRDAAGAVRVTNDGFTGKGAGLEMFGRQVETATALGISRIETHAAGYYVPGPDPNRTYAHYNGYVTWPKYGYDSPVPQDHYDNLPPGLKADVDREGGNVRGLMATKAGQDWWLKNGSDLPHAVFDLTPGSYSQRTLAAYLQKRGVLG